MFNHPDFDDHEGVHLFSDPKSGLRAIIAVHNTNRGPSAGGTRLWTYADPADAVADALRLSKAMSYKNAMAGLDLGGGKGVILKPDGMFDRTALFEAYGRSVRDGGRLRAVRLRRRDIKADFARNSGLHNCWRSK